MVRELTVAEVHEAIAASRPDDVCLVFRDCRLTWGTFTERTRRLANHLLGCGLTVRAERDTLAGHQSGQAHLAIYLHNGNEYLESMFGAFKARVAPFNVNYRYVADELRYLLLDAGTDAIVVHSCFAPTLAEVLPGIPVLRTILQVPDGSGNGLLPGAEWYEVALAAASPERPAVTSSPDDLYILYTGGTTGPPKGVLWRNADARVACFAGAEADSVDELVAGGAPELKGLPCPPFMHGAGHWVALRVWGAGGTVVIQSQPERLDADDIWSTIERERVNLLLIVGDAFAQPLLDGLDAHAYDLSSLTVVLSGGAPLSPGAKEALLARLPGAMVVDGLGSSEAGGQLAQVSAGGSATTGTFTRTADNHVLSAGLDRLLSPGDPELGWLAKSGRLALGYLGDPRKTAATYPVVEGVRYAVPGDRARLRSADTVEVHGRDSVTVNSGGEKVFVEEVEQAIKRHPAVYDCIVTGRPSTRWGEEVVAIVRLRDGQAAGEAELLAVAERHLARFKLPKSFRFVDEIVRSPAGKADYRWARRIAAED